MEVYLDEIIQFVLFTFLFLPSLLSLFPTPQTQWERKPFWDGVARQPKILLMHGELVMGLLLLLLPSIENLTHTQHSTQSSSPKLQWIDF